MRKTAAQMHQDLSLIKQVAPQAFERAAAARQGIKLQPENQNVMVEQSATSPTSTAGASAVNTKAAPAPLPAAAPVPNGGAPMAAPLPGQAPMAAPVPGGAPMAAPLPGIAPAPAPVPGGAPLAAPLPGIKAAPAPVPGGAPMAAPAPVPGGSAAAPVPMAPMGAPIPGAAAPPPMAPIGAAPAPMAGPPMPPSLGAPPMPPSLGAPPPMIGGPPPIGGGPPPIGGPRKPAFPKKKAIKPGIKMKTLHWKPINDKKIKGTIWEDITKLEDDIVASKSKVAFFAPGASMDNKDNKDKKKKGKGKGKDKDKDKDKKETGDEDKDKDKDKTEEKVEEKTEEQKQFEAEEARKEAEREKTLMELFAAKKKKSRGGGSKKGGGDKKEKKPKKELIEFIDGKRSYNVSIGLARFKMKNADIKKAVLEMNEDVFNVDKLYKLISLSPTPEEVTQCQEYEGPEDELAVCERFFYQFVSMDNVKERLQIWAYKMTFKEEYGDHERKVKLLMNMAKTIKESKGFKMTLATILACGNFINGGTKKGGKHGFELETLQKIGGYKTTDATMSILGYIFKFLRQNYPDSLKWLEEMETLPSVIRVETDNLDSEITKMEKDLAKVKDLLPDNPEEKKDNQDQFNDVMGAFYAEADEKVKALIKNFNDTITNVQDLAKFYGQKVKPTQFKVEEFFGIFDEFRSTFIENRDKIIAAELEIEKAKKKEAAKKKRAQEMEALKQKKKAEKDKKKKEREEKRRRKAERKKKVGFAADVGGDDDNDDKKKKSKKKKKGKTDKMLDEMGDAHKYLAKLRKNRKNKSKANLLGARKKSMFFKDRKQMMLDPAEIERLQNGDIGDIGDD